MSNNQPRQDQKPNPSAKPDDNQFQPKQKPDQAAKPVTADNKAPQAKPMEQAKKSQ